MCTNVCAGVYRCMSVCICVCIQMCIVQVEDRECICVYVCMCAGACRHVSVCAPVCSFLSHLHARFSISFNYFTLMLTMNNLDTNVYLTHLVTGVMKVPAQLCCIILLERVGKRLSLGIMFLQGSLLSLLILVLPTGNAPSLPPRRPYPGQPARPVGASARPPCRGFSLSGTLPSANRRCMAAGGHSQEKTGAGSCLGTLESRAWGGESSWYWAAFPVLLTQHSCGDRQSR